MRIPRSLAKFRRSGPEAEPEPEEEPTAAVDVAPAPEPEPEPERAPESAPAIALVQPPPPEPAPEPEPALPAVVPLAPRDSTPRAWNLWELERLAGALNGEVAASEERRLLLMHLREFADPSGDLPVEFDPLVRDAFGAGLSRLSR
jgi:hypothetical protein